MSVHSQRTSLMSSLMRNVYGDIWSSTFPLPLSVAEAGPAISGSQRRYLWTDAFAVTNLVSMAEDARVKSNTDESAALLNGAHRLVDAVHSCLGQPRDERYPMLRNAAGDGYVGLRIGKSAARSDTDDGMAFDGQYWHYLDKWLFAVGRLAVADRDESLLRTGIAMAQEVLPHFLVKNRDGKVRGLRWKVNVDMRPTNRASAVSPSDAVSAFVVYASLQDACTFFGLGDETHLGRELAILKPLAEAYKAELLGGTAVRGTDTLGWGLHMWESQWMGSDLHARLCREAAAVLHPRSLEGLPFRVFGGMLGARLCTCSLGAEKNRQLTDALINMVFDRHALGPACDTRDETDGLDAINKVMFCSCLNERAFRRQPHEVTDA